MDIEETGPHRRRNRPSEDLNRARFPLPTSRGGKNLNLEEKAYAFLQYKQGENINTIARNLNRSWKAVNDVVQKAEREATLDNLDSRTECPQHQRCMDQASRH